jgi:predicted esterase
MSINTIIYDNTIIYNSHKKHKYTFVMLHPMCNNSSYFDDYMEYFKKVNGALTSSIKFVLPESPIMDIDYPNNKQYNVKSWYNYYTCYNNLDKLDKINKDDFTIQTKKIVAIINNEAAILKSYKKLFIIGVSQGGTLLFNILKFLPQSLGGLFCIKSLYMYKYIYLKTNTNTPLFFYSGNRDEIYNLEFQQKCAKILEHYYIIKWTIIDNLDHHTKIEEEYDFIFRNFIELTKI